MNQHNHQRDRTTRTPFRDGMENNNVKIIKKKKAARASLRFKIQTVTVIKSRKKRNSKGG